MRMTLVATCVLALTSAASAQEGCNGTGTPLFHCTVKGGTKVVNICLQTGAGYYRFAPVNGPAELILSQSISDIYLTPWNGVGSSIYEELEMAAGDVTYRVYYAIDRIAADEPKITGGINVMRADQTLAELRCDKGSVKQAEFYPLFEAKEAAGQCWDHGQFRWAPC